MAALSLKCLLILVASSVAQTSLAVTVFYLRCNATLKKDLDPEASCSKVEQGARHDTQLIKKIHDEALQGFRKKFPAFRCFRESNKDRIQMQVFTVCRNQENSHVLVFLTSEPIDTRSKIYFSGLKMPWYEKDIGMYLYKKYLLPKPSWKQWLIP